MNRIIKGDKVRVISGKHKNSEGTVLKIFPKKGTAIVEGINKVKIHKKPDQSGEKGGIIEQEAPIRLCKLSIMDAKHKNANTRIKFDFDKNNKKIRITKKSGTNLAQK